MPVLDRRELLKGAVAAAMLAPLSTLAFATDTAVTPLVDAAWLKAHLKDPDVLIINVTSPRLYHQAHIPGSVFTDFGHWRKTMHGVPAMLPDARYLEKLIGSLGITPEKHVILVPAGFSAGDIGVATRIYWTLKTAGLKKLSILDGGLRDWAANKLPLANDVVKPTPSAFHIEKLARRWLASAADVKKALASGAEKLIDNRTPGEFVGIVYGGSIARPGTLPKAVNVPQEWLIDQRSGRFRPLAQLRRIHDALGAGRGAAINFCNTGHRASLGWFVRSELLGLPSRVYDGSMVEWSNLKPASDYPMTAKIGLK